MKISIDKSVRVFRMTKDQFGLDEIFMTAKNVHIERMDSGHVWMRIVDDHREIDLNFHAKKGTIEVTVIDSKSESKG